LKEEVIRLLYFFDVQKINQQNIFTSLVGLSTQPTNLKPVTAIPVNNSYLPKYMPVRSSGPSPTQTNPLTSLPAILAQSVDPATLPDYSPKFKPPSKRNTNEKSQLISFRFDSSDNLLSQQWDNIKIARSIENDVLVFQLQNEIFYISYLLDENKQPFLAKIHFNEKGKTVITKVDQLKNTKLVLSKNQKLDSNSYLLPYTDNQTKKTAFGVLQF
jgi:hypothetical protein